MRIPFTNGDSHHDSASMASTDVLIVGTGPAGAGLACFLASHGIRGIMISAASTNADTPRAHLTNMAAMECLRDIGLEPQCNHLATQGSNMMHTTWAYSLTGEEYARVYSWGHDPKRKGDYETASPCDPVDLPQSLLEPILVRYASLKGFNCRWDTSFVEFVQDGKSVVTTVKDNLSGLEYKVRSKYLFGADGARSEVLRQLGLDLDVRPDQGLAYNVHIKANLSQHMKHRPGVLHWLLQPDRDHPEFGWAAIARMVRPWNEWLFIVLPERDVDVTANPSDKDWLKRMKEFIGDDSIDAELLGVSKWRINDVVADTYSKGNVFCLGDAVHRHPPSNGLGSNTCIQDAFNLAWKVAYVLKGQASPSLLDTYSIERQPVGRGVVTRANQSFRHHGPVWNALGVLLPDKELRKQALDELALPNAQGQARRQALQSAIEKTAPEYHALGQEMGQCYQSTAVYAGDEPAPHKTAEELSLDPDLDLIRSTYPGARLPHVWLNTAIPSERKSTIDLAGKGAFCLFTGLGGEAWKAAAAQVGEALGVPVKAYSIGFRADYEDAYYDWARIRGVEETGCVLVRPDNFVAWRCEQVLDEVQCTAKLNEVMQSVLGRN